MRLRKNQAEAFGASVASACAARVCQPLPLARQAASTSGSRRKVTGILCTACTGRPPARRAMICSGVLTRPTPAKPSSMERNNASSNWRISGSALGLNFSSYDEVIGFDDGVHGVIVHLIIGIASQIKLLANVPVDGDPRANPTAALRQITHPRPSAVSAVYQVSK